MKENENGKTELNVNFGEGYDETFVVQPAVNKTHTTTKHISHIT